MFYLSQLILRNKNDIDCDKSCAKSLNISII